MGIGERTFMSQGLTINAKGKLGVLEIRFKLLNLLPELVGGVAQPSNRAEATGTKFGVRQRPLAAATQYTYLDTAAASSGPAATFMPASRIGFSMPRSLVRGV
jgi:hypothetical protein